MQVDHHGGGDAAMSFDDLVARIRAVISVRP
jgi:hypothetical protein